MAPVGLRFSWSHRMDIAHIELRFQPEYASIHRHYGRVVCMAIAATYIPVLHQRVTPHSLCNVFPPALAYS